MIKLYCNAATRQRLSRNLLSLIEFHQDDLAYKGLEQRAYDILASVKLGYDQIKDDVKTTELGTWLMDVSNEALIDHLALNISSPLTRKLWLLKPSNFEKWARKSSVLAVRF